MALLLLALPLLAACRSVEKTKGAPPFYEVYPSPSTRAWAGDEGGETFVRPFLSWERAEPGKRRLKVLFPFVDFRWKPEESLYWVLPIFRYQNRSKTGGGEDTDWMLFPFFFWGSDPEEGSYFAFVPFGGKMRGLLGQDEIDFALFPIWARLRTGKRYSTHILWPFINTVRGGGWSGGRFWPFYGRYAWNTEEGLPRSRRRFVLWPFYIRGTEDMQRDPREVFATYPFYGRVENSRALNRFYGWPFFFVSYDRKWDSTLVGGYFLPYRFQVIETDRYELYQYDPWPFFGWKRTRETLGWSHRTRLRQFALWPIQRYDRAEDWRTRSVRFWILPLYWNFYHIDKETGETERRWLLWPLMEYRRNGNDVSFELFSPLWFDREIYRRQYSRLFAVFRYRTAAEFRGWEVLYGTLYWGSDPEESVFSILGGLLELATKRGSFRIRLFYVPWW